MQEALMAEYEECETCGAAMANPAQHRKWHESVDGDIDKLKQRVAKSENSARKNVQRMRMA
jgi:hypothetical protein